MNLIEVTNRQTAKDFLNVPKILYKHDKNWICPLDNEIADIFNPAKNPFFNGGEAKRWILRDDNHQFIGRIAAFYNKKKAQAHEQPTGGIGFFECIHDKEAAFLLFNTAKDWLEGQGMEAMDGPVNFGENQNYWGLLVEGFMPQGFGMPYNFPYYQELFESYGFKIFFEQYSYHRDVVSVFPERFQRIVDWMSSRPGFHYERLDLSNSEKYINDIVEIYKQAWAEFKNDYTPLEHQDLRNSLNKLKSIIDEEIIWFAYHENKPIAFFILLPDINQILRHLNGKLSLWGKVKFFYYLKRKEITRVRALVAGVVPAFQNKGVESMFFKHLFDTLQNRPYTEIEMSWIGDYNPKMMAIYKAIGATHAKTHITYRYLFDRTKPFVRFKDIGEEEE